MDPSLDDIGKAVGDTADAMGPLIAMRTGLINGGFSIEAAEAIVLETIRSTLAQNLAKVQQGIEL